MRTSSILVVLALLLSGCAPAATPAREPVSNETAGPIARETPIPTIGAPTAPAVMAAETATSLPAPALTPQVQPTLLYTMTAAAGYVDTYFVDPGLDDPTPPLGGRVTLRARLIKNGVRLSGITHVSWVQGGERQSCDLFPVYLSGCMIEVRDFTPGVFVPVTVTIRYLDMVFTGYSGFTPQ